MTDPFADARPDRPRSSTRPATTTTSSRSARPGPTRRQHTVTQAEIDAGGNCDADDPADELRSLCNIATADSDQTEADTDDAVVPVSQIAVAEHRQGGVTEQTRSMRPAT